MDIGTEIVLDIITQLIGFRKKIYLRYILAKYVDSVHAPKTKVQIQLVNIGAK